MGERFKGDPWTESETDTITSAMTSNPEDSPWVLAKKIGDNLPNRTLRSVDAKIRGLVKKANKPEPEVEAEVEAEDAE